MFDIGTILIMHLFVSRSLLSKEFVSITEFQRGQSRRPPTLFYLS